MLVVVSYDVDTTDAAGRRRLRRIAKACQDSGKRVQFSVFECEVSPSAWLELKSRLRSEFNPDRDSLRFYFLGADGNRRIEHLGSRKPIDLDGPLLL